MVTTKTFDFIVAGGGQAGCVVASRLSQALPHASVALIEAGPDAHDDPLIQSAMGGPMLHNTDHEWNYMTTPQRHLDDRRVYHCGGKVLSGSSAVNYGQWVRGDATDYDSWGKKVGDSRWSYKSLLPYFRKTETHYLPRDKTSNPDEHGFDGPIKTIPALDWPLSKSMKEGFAQVGFEHLADTNSGQPLGLGTSVWTWHNDTRQAAGTAYDLSTVTVLTKTSVRRIVLEKQDTAYRAVGVQTTDGQEVRATKEVIVSCGAFKTPQLLMVSGVGSKHELESVGVEQLVDCPGLGKNLHDHPSAILYWKLKHPEQGLAILSENFPMQKQGPADWVFTGSAPKGALVKALEKDGISDAAAHYNVNNPRAHYEMVIGYGPIGVPENMTPSVPMDGSIVSTGMCAFATTSRGSISLTSADIADDPAIDPNYLATQHDWCLLRESLRNAMRLMEAPAIKEHVQGQWQPDGFQLNVDSSDEELDARIKPFSSTWYHPGGTAAMGNVVDTECRVKGVHGLRVVDASVIPDPLGSHYQAPVYALAEQASDMIASAAANA